MDRVEKLGVVVGREGTMLSMGCATLTSGRRIEYAVQMTYIKEVMSAEGVSQDGPRKIAADD